ncbi:hypothetical protein FH609_012055 [Streptomyces sp. 3MP-14]|uniref:Uncharacterized protein n=1 Tax=Streptomyces mimosae TaxID=2586635 RepID=A0A5N6AEP2_9ACTN|nr:MULTISPECIES: Uma2 family endonuclease [Streptomyces]KAB8167121.1 hypothetical protein FH607_009505 [Streptomyces mimosae]KAB8177062.1 hypothetical protein FH609_012055 [Streptomyces sp. 3MP-14]
MDTETDLDPSYDWPRPPLDGYVADDLDRLPNLPGQTELLDGILVVPARRTIGQGRVQELFEVGLAAAVPEGLCAIREMTITLGRRDRPEPDVPCAAETSTRNGNAIDARQRYRRGRFGPGCVEAVGDGNGDDQ